MLAYPTLNFALTLSSTWPSRAIEARKEVEKLELRFAYNLRPLELFACRIRLLCALHLLYEANVGLVSLGREPVGLSHQTLHAGTVEPMQKVRFVREIMLRSFQFTANPINLEFRKGERLQGRQTPNWHRSPRGA